MARKARISSTNFDPLGLNSNPRGELWRRFPKALRVVRARRRIGPPRESTLCRGSPISRVSAETLKKINRDLARWNQACTRERETVRSPRATSSADCHPSGGRCRSRETRRRVRTLRGPGTCRSPRRYRERPESRGVGRVGHRSRKSNPCRLLLGRQPGDEGRPRHKPHRPGASTGREERGDQSARGRRIIGGSPPV